MPEFAETEQTINPNDLWIYKEEAKTLNTVGLGRHQVSLLNNPSPSPEGLIRIRHTHTDYPDLFETGIQAAICLRSSWVAITQKLNSFRPEGEPLLNPNEEQIKERIKKMMSDTAILQKVRITGTDSTFTRF